MKNNKVYNVRKLHMLTQLGGLCLQLIRTENLRHLPPPECWPKTRELAELCDENIYTTRTLLLRLEREGKVQSTSRPINNSLRWFIRIQ